MTEAEKLLQETKSAVVADAQTEDICIIDSNLRIASIPESFKVLGVEHDKDVRVVQFRMPKLYKNIDLSTFTISVNYQNANGIKDRYLVTDKNVSSDYIEFSWTVGSAATKYKGDTKFIVCMRMIGTEGIIEKEFNTTLATMTVLEGLEVDNPVIEQEEKDIIAQLLQIVDDKSKEAVQAVTAEGTKQIKAVQAAAQEIAADREQIKTNKADITDLRQTKAGAIINSAKGERIAVGDSAGAFFEGLKLFGKSEQVQTKGYQLFDASKIPTKSAGGATVTNNGDGSFTISGSGNLTSDFDSFYQLTDREEIKRMFKVGKIYLKNNGITFPYFHAYFQSTDGSRALTITDGKEHDLTEDILNNAAIVGFSVYANSGDTITIGTIRPMLYQDGDGTWEPYTGGKPSPSMEYKQDPESSGDSGVINVNVGEENTQHLSIQTPNDLPGIKVDSGGNYTDSNGQQWICDEMDFKRGKYVQRINKSVLDGSNDENWSEFTGVNLTKTKRFASAPYAIPAVDKSLVDSCITNRFLYLRNDSDKEHFRLSTSNGVFNQVVLFTNVDTVSDVNALKNWLKANPVEILVPLAAPIETDIPEETMTAYRNLCTNYPSTVIQNDSGAGMEVEYVADTKSYIDNKLKELVQA